jgi:hypothetical protein
MWGPDGDQDSLTHAARCILVHFDKIPKRLKLFQISNIVEVLKTHLLSPVRSAILLLQSKFQTPSISHSP